MGENCGTQISISSKYVRNVEKYGIKENGMEKHRALSMKAVEMELGQTEGKYERDFFSHN